MNQARASIDFTLLERLTDEFVCTRCFQEGIVTPLTQVVSKFHRPRTLCRDCEPLEKERPAAQVVYLNA